MYSQDAGPLTREQFVRTQFYEEWACETPLFWGYGGWFFRRGNRVGVFGCHRSEGEGRFPLEVGPYLAAFMPHLKQAFTINEQFSHLQNEIDAYRAHAQDRGVGQVLLDGRGAVLFATETALAALRSGGLSIVQGRLTTPIPGQQAMLDARIGSALAPIQRADQALIPTLAIYRGEQRSALYVNITRFQSEPVTEMFARQPRCLVMVRDPEALNDSHVESLSSALHLTRVHALLAIALARGEALEVHAERRGIARETARSYRKTVLKKLGVHSQAELVSVVLNALL